MRNKILKHCRICFSKKLVGYLDLGKQPFSNSFLSFKDIKKDLNKKGYHFRSGTDTEVLLNLYLEVGQNILEQLNGIFAFAIWDLGSKSLFVARDGLGVKPLYYCESNHGFSFSSEIKALLQLDTVKKSIDYESLNRYLTFLWCPGEGTPLKSVKKLQPGEAMIVQKGEVVRKWKWYQLPKLQLSSTATGKRESIINTQSLLRQAVHRQMVADVHFYLGG